MTAYGVPGAPDILDAVDYNPIDHLNALFSQPSTLSSVSAVSRGLRRYEESLDLEVSNLITTQTTTGNDSVQRIQLAKGELAELFEKIGDVQERALQTERSITEMTADIKKLDSTKRNLTVSMTALKRLQMLTTAYEQLKDLSKSRQYRDCSHLLEAVIALMAHFRAYRSIDEIAVLSKNIAELQRELLEQICEDFELAFARAELQQKRNVLSQACAVIDALGDHARARLITWYCNTQLREYRQIFRGNDEAGSLDNISRRYSWFNRMLKTYDAEHAMLFPAHWHVNEMLANTFCDSTREDYKAILQRSMRRADGQAPDVNLLVSCLQETLDFEHSLEVRFEAGHSRSSIDTANETIEEKRTGFTQAISNAFEPYLSLWVESQDRQLAALLPKYKSQPIRSPEDEFHAQLVLPSSTELFNHYRITLAQCAKLSTGQRLLDLSRTFAKYLELYAQQVLLDHLTQSGQGLSVENTVIIINTADYCFQTTNQLEEKIKSRIDAEFVDSVDLQSSADAFMAVASTAVRTLVHKAEVDCEPVWREMRAIAWAKMDTVGDQSSYVAYLLQRVRDRSKEILKSLQKPQYVRAYCDNLVDVITSSYMSNIVAGRPISETGAEQLLLDLYVLKKGLGDLATLNSESGTTPNAAFVKRVNQSASKIDPILKTIQVRSSPPEGLVQAYLIHIRDKSELNFRKILDLKGINKKSDQSSLLELFNVHKSTPANEALPATNAYMSAISFAAPQSITPLSGLAALKERAEAQSTPSLPARFDPTNFGSALIDAARQGVDRFGSPHLGGSAVVSSLTSRATSPLSNGQTTVNGRHSEEGERGPISLNENLKNFWKFRREGSGFGGFGRRD